MSQSRPHARMGAILVFIAAALFFATAVIGGQATFYALGTVFLVLGVSTFARHGRNGDRGPE